MADINILGHKVSPLTVGAVVIGGGAAIWFAYKQHEASASAATSASSIDPVTGLPYSEDDTTDPLTGMTYLSEAEEYGSVSAAEQAVAAESSEDLEDEYSGESDLTGTSTGTTGVTTEVPVTGYTTNAQWAAAVQAGLVDIGYSATDVAAALGAYLGSLPETSTQAGIVSTALAEYGPPPVGSYTIILASSTPPVTTGPTPPVTAGAGGPITVAPSGFRVVSVTDGDNVNLAWNKLTPPSGQGPVTQYVIAYGPTSGSQQYKQYAAAGDTAATVAGVGAGSAGKHYFELWADPADTNGPHAGPVEATTTKS